MSSLARGACEAAALVALFLAFGLGWAEFERGGGTARPYPRGVPTTEPAGGSPRIWLVDGYNVLCAGVLGVRDRRRWWSEENRGQLLELAARFDDAGAEVWVVFDGDRDSAGPEMPRLRVVFAAPADDWLLAAVKERAAAAQVALVTADRSLAERARQRGAQIVPPRDFVRRCLG
jgi:predicted RNA-binding protein with PIN domain